MARVVNVMLGLGLGGIEQSLVDYTKALEKAGHHVHLMVRSGARVMDAARGTGAPVWDGVRGGPIDLPSRLRIFWHLKKTRPHVLIAHGGRAVQMTRLPCRLLGIPQIGVCHNYRFQHVGKADFLFAITHDIIHTLKAKGMAPHRLFHVPNMVDLPACPPPIPLKPIQTIGAMGRFVPKKGFHLLLDALVLLKERGLTPRLHLAGSGPEEENLKSRTHQLGLQDQVHFLGWIQDKKTFFHGIDVFCVPSTHEPFGIVLLDAMAAGCPLVSSKTEGPAEIITDGQTGLLCAVGDAGSLADALVHLIHNPPLAQEMAQRAYSHVAATYTIQQGANTIDHAIHVILSSGKKSGIL